MSRLLIAALVIVMLGFLARWLGPQTIGEQIRRHVVKQLQKQYPDLKVSIRRGHYEPSVGVILEDIQIAQQGSLWQFAGGNEPMVRVERLTVVGKTKPELLLEKRSPLETKGLVIDGLHINARMNSDGELSLSKLWPPPSFGPTSVPRINIRRASLRWISNMGDSAAIGANIDSIQILSKIGKDGLASQKITVAGRLSFAKQFAIEVDSTPAGIKVYGKIDRSRLNATLFDQIKNLTGQNLDNLAGLNCLCDASFVVRKAKDQPVDFLVKTNVAEGVFRHPRLPATISGVNGLATIRPSGVQVHQLSGAYGGARWTVAGQSNAVAWPCELAMKLNVDGFLIDKRLALSLPPNKRKLWDLLHPHGHIDVTDATVTYQNGKWITKSATVDCKGVDVKFSKFPYPVQQLVGRVTINEGIASCERMTGQVRGTQMNCGFRLPLDPKLTKERLVVVSTDGPVAIDNVLLGALTPQLNPTSKLETFVRSLNPRGNVHLVNGTFRTDMEGTRHQDIDLTISGGQLRYKNFAYPLYNVQGNVRVQDQLVTMSEFHAVNNNGGNILCDGTYQMPMKNAAGLTTRDSSLVLKFRAARVPMDDALRSALPASAQQTWDSLSPSGVLDYLVARVDQNGGANPVQIRLAASEVESAQGNREVLSIQPPEIPYRLDIANGHVVYDGTGVVIKSVRAVHEATSISAAGNCYQNQDGRWQLVLDIHGGSRVNPDAQLVRALPDQVRQGMRSLQLRRPVSVRGRTSLFLADQKHPTPQFDWDVVMQLEGNRIGDVGPVRSLRGEIKSRGVSSEQGVYAEGEVRIDSMHVYDLQFTSIRGPYRVQNDRLMLGRHSQLANQTQPARAIRGKLFDGEIQLNGEALLSSATFDVQVALSEGKVPTLLASLGYGQQALTGTFNVDMDLEGTVGTTELLAGSGKANVTGANLYQLPLLVQLLNLLRITPTEDVAFTDSTVDFRIVEDQLNFDDLKLWGDLVTLHGGGTLNRRLELDLAFNTRVSPNNTFSKIVRPLRSQKYSLWDVDVRGPISDPDVELRRLDKMLPNVNNIRRVGHTQ